MKKRPEHEFVAVKPFMRSQTPAKEIKEKFMEKGIESIKKSKILQNYRKDKLVLLPLSEKTLRDDPLKAYEMMAKNKIPDNEEFKLKRINTGIQQQDKESVLGLRVPVLLGQRRTVSDYTGEHTHWFNEIHHEEEEKLYFGNQENNARFEELLLKNSKQTRSKRGAMIGAGAVAIIGGIFTGGILTLTAIILGVIGGLVGGVFGNRFKNNFRTMLQKMKPVQRIIFKVQLYKKVVKRSFKSYIKNDPMVLSYIIEKIMEEVASAFQYQATNKKIRKLLLGLRKYLISANIKVIMEKYVENYNKLLEKPDMEREVIRIIFQCFMPILTIMRQRQPKKADPEVYEEIKQIVHSAETMTRIQKMSIQYVKHIDFISYLSKPQEDEDFLEQILATKKESKSPKKKIIERKGSLDTLCGWSPAGRKSTVRMSRRHQMDLLSPAPQPFQYLESESPNILEEEHKDNIYISHEEWETESLHSEKRRFIGMTPIQMKAENVLLRLFTNRMQTMQCQGDNPENEAEELIDLDEEDIILHLPDLDDEDEEESSGSDLSSNEEADLDAQSHRQLELSFRQDSASVIHLLRKPTFIVDPEFEHLATIVNENMSTWKLVCRHPDIVLYKKKIPGSPIVMVRGTAICQNISQETLYYLINDAKIRKDWDKIFSRFELVEDFPEQNTQIIYYAVKAPFGASNRDFLTYKKVLFDYPLKGDICMHFRSVEHKDCPPVKKHIRGNVLIAGYIFRTISVEPLQSCIYIVSQNDIKGLIPKFIVNMVASKAPRDWMNNLRKASYNHMGLDPKKFMKKYK